MGSRKSKVKAPITELTVEQITEICHQTNLIDSEVRRRYLAFLEQYPDGLMTRQQLYDCLHEVWPDGHIDKFASYLFDTFDQDRNGIIDFVEFIKLTYKLDVNDENGQNNDEQIFFGLVFDMFDRNHDGYLEKHELKPLIKSLYDLTGLPQRGRRGKYSPHAQVQYLIKKFDINGDKRLSKQEFLDQEKWNNDKRLERCFSNYFEEKN